MKRCLLLLLILVMLPLKTLTESGAEGVFYEHITGAIGDLNVSILLPILLGAVLAFVLLTRAVDWMMNHHYSVMFHGIIGLVIAATIFTIPFAAFTAGVSSCLIHLVFVVLGCVATLLLDKFNAKVEKPPVEE